MREMAAHEVRRGLINKSPSTLRNCVNKDLLLNSNGNGNSTPINSNGINSSNNNSSNNNINNDKNPPKKYKNGPTVFPPTPKNTKIPPK